MSNAPRPNILTRMQEHRLYCQNPPELAWSGDVRRCEHGRIQMAHAVPGFGSAQWFDLSPLAHPLNYRRARRVLSPGGGDA